MTDKTKKLFESLTLLRYAADQTYSEITHEEIEEAYYDIMDLLTSMKFIEDSREQAEKDAIAREQRKQMAHQKVIENFGEWDAVKIAADVSTRMGELGINKSYVITELSTGEIGIIDGKNNPHDIKNIIRKYNDSYDYLININDDLKADFKREKLFSNIKKLSKNKNENID